MKEEVIVETIVEGSDKAVKELDAVAKATKDAKDESEEYKDQMKDTAGEVELFGVSMNGIRGAFTNMIKGLKLASTSLGVFKTALIATGVGALVVALGALVAWLTSTQEGIDLVNKALGRIKAVISAVTGVFVKMGEALSNIFNVSLSETIGKVADSFDGFTDSVNEAVIASDALIVSTNELAVATAKNTQLAAFYELQIAKNKRTAEDVTKGTATQIKAQEEVIRLQGLVLDVNQEVADQALANVQNEINALRAAEGGRAATIVEMQAISDATAEVFAVQQANEEARTESQVRLNDLRKQSQEEYLSQTVQLESVELPAIRKKANDTELQEIEGQNDAKLGMQIDFQKQSAALAKEQREAQSALDLANAQLTAQMEYDLVLAIADLAGQESILGRAIAIGDATRNTWIGVTEALKAITITQRVLGVAYALTTGLNAVKQITGTPIPKVQIVDNSPFGEGGVTRGPSHDRGGIWINAEGGEGIINKRSMSLPWVREQASALNEVGGGVRFANGGVVVPNGLEFLNLEAAFARARPVLVTESLDAVENNVVVTNSLARL